MLRNPRSRDCRGAEPRRNKRRHRSLCSGINRDDRENYRLAGFEPDVRFEKADPQPHIRLVESGNAVVLLPDLVWIGRGTTARHGEGSVGGDIWATDLRHFRMVDLSFRSSRLVLYGVVL